MHCCLLLITREMPSENRISEILKPYNEENLECDETGEIISFPIFTYDWWEIGGRYSGKLKLKIDNNDEKYDWKYISDRNKKLFHSKLLTDLQKSKKILFENIYYRSMGSRDGFLYVDGARIDDLLNFDEIDCFVCIDFDKNVIARETWNGHAFIKDEDFDKKLAEIKAKSKGMFATILDIHN